MNVVNDRCSGDTASLDPDEQRSVDQLLIAVELVAEGTAGVTGVQVTRICWTWRVAQQVQALANQKAVSVWVVAEDRDGWSTVAVRRRENQ